MALLALLLIDVLTYHNDLARTGQNLAETVLTTQNVNAAQFGKRATYPVDGEVYAQPLVFAGSVFVATEHDSVYAFSDGGPTWKVSLLPPGATTVPNGDVNCGQISPEIGITATPVIDPATATIYVVAMSKENGSYVHRLHALDTATGAERPGSPVVISASVPGKGDGGATVSFIPKNYKERAGLVLWNGTVYTTWASHCDEFVYHGWVIAYDAKTLAQTGVYNNTPNARGASFWASGAAPAVDASGALYLVGGNGDFNADRGGTDLGNTFLKLTSTLSVTDYFAPFNYSALNAKDLDLGSSGALLLPEEAGSAAHPHLLVSAGKEGRVYLLDRDNLGKFQPNSDSQIVQSLTGVVSPLFGIPVYFRNTVYFSGAGDNLKAFSIPAGQLNASPTSATAVKFPGFGSVPSISANGTANGIVWTTQNVGGAGLFAFDASNLGKELYRNTTLGSYVKFSTPTAANGKIYVGTQNSLVVFGLLAAPTAPVALNAASYQPGVSPGSIISIFGSGFTTSPAAQADGYPLPLALAGISVSIGGRPAPLYYASPTQINAQVPVEIPANLQSLVITTRAGAVNGGTVVVQATAPGVFVAVNSAGVPLSATNPATAGAAITVYATGIGQVENPTATGNAAPVTPLSRARAAVSATVNNLDAAVTFAGLAPGFAGLGQVNLTLPAKLAPGSYPLVVNVGGVAANTVMVTVR